MTLQLASSAKSTSDAATIETRTILSSLIMAVIDAEITTQSARTDLDVRTFKAEFTIDADTNGGNSPAQLIQSDSSRVLLSDLEGALTDAGYKISEKTILSSRTGVSDKVKLQVSWA